MIIIIYILLYIYLKDHTVLFTNKNCMFLHFSFLSLVSKSSSRSLSWIQAKQQLFLPNTENISNFWCWPHHAHCIRSASTASDVLLRHCPWTDWLKSVKCKKKKKKPKKTNCPHSVPSNVCYFCWFIRPWNENTVLVLVLSRNMLPESGSITTAGK